MVPAALLLSPPGRLVASGPIRCHAPTQQSAAAPAASSSAARALPSSSASPAAGSSGTGPARASRSPPPQTAYAGTPPSPPTPCCPLSTGEPSIPLPGPTASSRRFPSSAVYWLYYTGSTDERFSSPFPAADVPALPGLAISQDGRHWARIEGDHHSCALLGAGEEEEEPTGWEARYLAAPKVVMHADGDLRMYYHSFDEMSQRHTIGVARSRDGIRWTNAGKVIEGGRAGTFDERGVRHGHVIRDRATGRYVMVYEGVDANGMLSIGMAISEDGLKWWRRCSEMPVLCPSEEDEGWDGAGVGSPCFVQMDGAYDWRLYYMGVRRDGESSIGMAYSEGQALQKFEKCDAVRV